MLHLIAKLPDPLSMAKLPLETLFLADGTTVPVKPA